ncbi:MAG: hypothetical protein ABSC94_17740 [Polyangiaceae bacterium]
MRLLSPTDPGSAFAGLVRSETKRPTSKDDGRFGVPLRMAGAVLLAAVLGCQGASATDSNISSPLDCPSDLPSTCPSPAPSWSGEVQTIIEDSCGRCHAEGGIEQSVFDFSSYEGVYEHRGSILDQVYACAMPPPDAGPLPPADRSALLGWLVCSAPEN